MDPRTSIWISVDPLAEKYPNISSYVYCLNNPVKYVDPDGKDPREGNLVLNINFDNNYITKINDPSPKAHRYDKALDSKALDEFASRTPIGGNIKSMGSELADIIISIWEGASNKLISSPNKAFAWVSASQSKTGYQYIEFVKLKGKEYNIRRQIVNLNEQLGVEGFENVVKYKQTCEGKSNNVLIEEYWNYRTTENKKGEKKIEYQHITIDLTKPTGDFVTRSGWQEAKPSQYKPNENKNK